MSEDGLKELTHISRQVDEILNRQPNRHAPFVGASAFATKAGIHASAVMKDPRTYEHVEPDVVGNVRRVLVSDQGGQLERPRRTASASESRWTRRTRGSARVLEEVKRKEAQGYAFEGADASFYVLVKRLLGRGAGLLRGRALLGQHGAALQRASAN